MNLLQILLKINTQKNVVHKYHHRFESNKINEGQQHILHDNLLPVKSKNLFKLVLVY